MRPRSQNQPQVKGTLPSARTCRCGCSCRCRCLPFRELLLPPSIPKSLTTLLSCFLRRYGDRLPLSFVARIIAIVWTVAGVILTGLLVSAISVCLTGETIGVDYKLYGAKVICRNYSCLDFSLFLANFALYTTWS